MDIRGAGDSFAEGTALTMAMTRGPMVAVGFGNLVASITVTIKERSLHLPQKCWL